jgi:hypothetical protein
MIAEPQRWEKAQAQYGCRAVGGGGESAGGYYIYHLVNNMSVKRAESMFTVEQGEAAFSIVWCHINPENLACSLYDTPTPLICNFTVSLCILIYAV